jgi:hypothetical protein
LSEREDVVNVVFSCMAELEIHRLVLHGPFVDRHEAKRWLQGVSRSDLIGWRTPFISSFLSNTKFGFIAIE